MWINKKNKAYEHVAVKNLTYFSSYFTSHAGHHLIPPLTKTPTFRWGSEYKTWTIILSVLQ